MDFENQNNAFDEEKATEVTETEKAIDSFLNGSVYTEEDEKKDKEANKFLTNKEALICAVSLFALLVWNLNGYGAILVSALALLAASFLNVGKNAMRVCVSNALSLGCMAIVRVAISVLQIIIQTFYFFVLEKNLSTSFSNFISLTTNIIGILVFVFFIINAFCLMSKKHTPIFGGVAKSFAERE